MVTPLRMNRTFLTGNVRGRPRRFFRTLIMQVELRVESAGAFDILKCPPPPNCADFEAWKEKEQERVDSAWSFKCFTWRDATWLDSLELEKIHGLEPAATASRKQTPCAACASASEPVIEPAPPRT